MALSLQANRLYRFEPHKLYTFLTHVSGDIFRPDYVEGIVLDPGTFPGQRPPHLPSDALAIAGIRRPVLSDFTAVRPGALTPLAARNYEFVKLAPPFGDRASRDAGKSPDLARPYGATPSAVRRNLASQGVPFLDGKPVNPNSAEEVGEAFRRMISEALGIPMANIEIDASKATTVPADHDLGFAAQGAQRWDGYPFPPAAFRLDGKDYGLHKLYRNSAGELCVLLEFQSGPDMGYGRAFGRRQHNGKQWRAHSWDVLHHDLRPVTGVEMQEGNIYKFPDGSFGRVPVGAKRQMIDGKPCIEVHELRDDVWVPTPFIWIAVSDADNFMQAASASEVLHINKAMPDPIKDPLPAVGSLWKRRVSRSSNRVYKVLAVEDGQVWMRYYTPGVKAGVQGALKHPLGSFRSHFEKVAI